MASNDTERVVVVGGGLAGMTAAYELSQRGCRTTLIEASDRLGGKAGASVVNGNIEEHGYHIFPLWYENVWRLIDELDIRGSFEDVENFHQLRPNQYPSYSTYRNLTSARYFFRNLRAGVLSVPEQFLFFYAALDLMSQPYRYRAKLDQITITGFLRSRFYGVDSIAEQFEDLMLKGISVPIHEVSAMTMRNTMRYWLRYPLPMHRILNTDLQSGFITPFEDQLVEHGCTIETEQQVVKLVPDDGRIQSVRIRSETGVEQEYDVDAVVLAIPTEQVLSLLDDELYTAASDLSDLNYLTARPMAALHIHFTEQLPSIPRDHVNLLESRYGLSYVDVSQWWDEHDPTVLNVIASDFRPLVGLSAETATRELIADLKPYLPPFDESAIQTTYLQPHETEPLFTNEVGVWPYRPTARTSLSNLYMAGDYCQSHVDLVSMEGAVTTGLHAAKAACEDLDRDSRVDIRVPKTYPRELLVLGKVALAPIALLARHLINREAAPESVQ
ncbi:NAD-binding domain and a Fe-S cluster-containing protein [Halogranum rubrum]|uniref:NAD-binding domain and a Fe-S cluster-containing protein n=1 Tax=Halogranum rubrum TaxID=553466 RepID=A0A1I4HWU3_9EURY|nr:FAD-dependent oxidoreductase [Halogranum rubrum]SFL45886.1 NAD-binding domain and a Fe-S cluster-containing protein [Halogranum rubrum]